MRDTLYPSAPILLVDDESSWLHTFQLLLCASVLTHVETCQDGRSVMDLLKRREMAVVALDLNMPDLSGEELLAMIAREYPDLRVIVITGVNQVEQAVRCMKQGAFDYFVKSTETSRLVAGLRRAIELRELEQENRKLKDGILGKALAHPEAFTGIVTLNQQMLSVFRYVEAIATTTQPVLIMGESGVGKELIARAIHALSGRRGKFIAVNAAGVDENVFNDTLYGHRKGAFTGADETRPGLVESAAGGALFLDEIGDLPVSCQVKLLRLLQEREYTPLGSDVSKKTDARVILATHRDLRAQMADGRFRKDLYFRLTTHTIHIPPLRERKDDLPLLVDHFLAKSARELGKPQPTPPPQLITLLRTYAFPGNVRELEAMVFDALSRHASRMLSMDSFKAHIQESGAWKTPSPEGPASDMALWATFSDPLPTMKETDRILVAEAMKRAEGNQSVAAQMLGITRQALNRRLRQKT